MKKKLSFKALKAKQGSAHTVFAFAASADEIFSIATIEHAGRSEDGDLFGFQRPQISAHIHEIRDYLQREDAVLPNSVVLAFTDHVSLKDIDEHFATVEVDISDGPPGLIVDGQQRLTALRPLNGRPFEVFVSGLICNDPNELRKQFILINNTRPLPKELIYELLPTVDALPARLSNRSFASAMTQRLNFDRASSLYHQIKLHTNPEGVLASNSIQRVIMNSRGNGAFRDLLQTSAGEEGCFQLISGFFAAVQSVFNKEWVGMNPKTSRLVHSAGILAMGYVMEVGFALYRARDVTQFTELLSRLKGQTAWIADQEWPFRDNPRSWKEIQNVNSDIRLLSEHLIRVLKLAAREDEDREVARRVAR